MIGTFHQMVNNYTTNPRVASWIWKSGIHWTYPLDQSSR